MLATLNHFEIPLLLRRMPRSDIDIRIDSAKAHLVRQRRQYQAELQAPVLLEVLDRVRTYERPAWRRREINAAVRMMG